MSERPLERAIRKSVEGRDILPDLLRVLPDHALKLGLDYDLGPGQRVPIPLMATPALLDRDQVRFLRRLSSAVNGMIRRMPELYLADEAVREVLPFPADEEAWVRDCYRPATRQPLVTRIDCDLPNHRTSEVHATVAFEPNGVSVGGLYYAGAGSRILTEVVLPPAARRRLRPLAEPCAMVTRLIGRHARAIGIRGRPRVGILENRDWTEGITEMPRLAEFLEAAGMSAVIGDPRDLERVGQEWTLGGQPVDVFYRNMDVRDLADVEADGSSLSALREAFRRDRVVSGISGDFDHKSLWEVLTSRRTRHVVPDRYRPLFRRHLLWTRLLRDTRTEGPDGDEVDLVPWVRRNLSRLVLKPNRSCGGDRVTMGPEMDPRTWERAVDAALADDERWVVQSFHPASRKPFPVLREDRIVTEHAYVCYGVVAIDHEVGIVGRSCGRRVVNVSSGGGLMAVFLKA